MDIGRDPKTRRKCWLLSALILPFNFANICLENTDINLLIHIQLCANVFLWADLKMICKIYFDSVRFGIAFTFWNKWKSFSCRKWKTYNGRYYIYIRLWWMAIEYTELLLMLPVANVLEGSRVCHHGVSLPSRKTAFARTNRRKGFFWFLHSYNSGHSCSKRAVFHHVLPKCPHFQWEFMFRILIRQTFFFLISGIPSSFR